MTNISPEILRQINLDIVKRWPYSACNQIDTYVRNDDPAKFNMSNLSMTYQDYLNGDFWSRYWTGQGASADNLEFKYPVLAQQSLLTRGGDIDEFEQGSTNKYTETGSILFVGKYDCPECGECNRTQWQVSDDTKAMLMAYIDLVFSYGYYEVTDSEGSYFAWFSGSVIQVMLDSGEIQSYKLKGDLYQNLTFSSDLIEWAYNPAGNVIGWTLDYELTYCFTNDIQLSNTLEDYRVVGQVGCENC